MYEFLYACVCDFIRTVGYVGCLYVRPYMTCYQHANRTIIYIVFFFYFLFTEMCILNDLSKFLFCHLINKSKFNFTAEKFIKLCTTYNGYIPIPIPIPIRRMCVWVCASEFFLSFVHETVLTTMLSILFLAHFVFIKFCTLFDSYKPKINFICK